jgi:RNA polymerase sigma factor (sigma-70 family)
VARLLSRDEFEVLYRATAPELFGYVRRRTPSDAEDIVAEVFATAWRRRADLPAASLRRAWLFGTARNVMLAESRRVASDAEAVAQVATAPTSVERTPEDARAEIVTAALSRLTPRDREVIELTEWERLSPAELAVALGVRPGTARVRLHRARQALASDPEIAALVDPATRRGLFVST